MQADQHVLGHAGRMQQFDGLERHHRGLLGRFGQHAVAGDQGRRHLTQKNRQREIPGADADPGATPQQAQAVALAGQAQGRVVRRQGQRLHQSLRLLCVVAQEIDRLAHLANRIAPGLEGFLDQDRGEARQLLLQRVGSGQQHAGALFHRALVPGVKSLGAAGQRCGGLLGRRHGNAGQRQCRMGSEQGFGHGCHRQVQAGAVAALRAVDSGRQDQGVGALGVQRRNQQQVQVHGRVGQLVHERGIGAVFQQTPHQVGQQIAVRADRGVDAAGHRMAGQYLAVNAVAHAVQALQLERRARAFSLCQAGHLQNRRDGAGVVRGELRVDRIRRRQQRARTGQVAGVRVLLVCEHRVMRQPQLLGVLDFAVPVGALDQAAHQAQLVAPRQRNDVIDQLLRPRLVSLQGQAKTLPLRVMRGHLLQQGFEQVQRQLQAFDFFGVYRQVDIRLCSQCAQFPHAWQQLGHDARVLAVFIAGMERAEFDRYTVVLLYQRRIHWVLSYLLDSIAVAGQVAQRIRVGAGAFAQHVVAEAQARLLRAAAVGFLHGAGNALTEHELAPQQLHGAHRGRNHGACAQACDQTGLGVGALLGQKLLGQRNRRRRQARQHGVAVAVEIGAAQLVGGEGDGGLGVGHAQQGLGQAHQRQTFGAGDRVFLQQAFHGPERRRVVAHRLDPGPGQCGGLGPVQPTWRLGQQRQTLGDQGRFGAVGVR